MSAKTAQKFILAAMLIMASLMMAVDCGPMNYPDIRQAIVSWRPAAPPVWSPDGSLVVYNKDAAMHWIASDGSSTKSFPHARERSLEHERIVGCGNNGCPPLGRLEHAFGISVHNVIVFTKLRDNGVDEPILDIETMHVDGSNRSTIATGAYPSWSPDGTQIAFFDKDGLRIMSADGSDSRYIVKDADYLSESFRNPRSVHGAPPKWSPDGRHIAFVVRDQERFQDSMVPRKLYVINANGDNLTLIGETMAEPAWSPEGRRLAFMQENGGLMTIYTVLLTGKDMRKVTSFPTPPPQAFGKSDAPRGRMAWSSDGSQIRVLMSPLVTVNLDGTGFRIMIFPWDTLPHYESEYPEFAAFASWSPDDTAIAVYILRYQYRSGPFMLGLFTMTSDWTGRKILVNEFSRYSDEELIDGLQWMDRDEYLLLLSNKALPDSTEVPQ